MTSRNSTNELGQPWVSTSGVASGSGERTCRKWMVCPSISVVYCAIRFSRASCSRQSNSSRQYVASPFRYSTGTPRLQSLMGGDELGHRIAASRLVRSSRSAWLISSLKGRIALSIASPVVSLLHRGGHEYRYRRLRNGSFLYDLLPSLAMKTSSRLLRLLALLPTKRSWSVAALAQELEVTARTIRNDIERLREAGYSVDSAAGVEGGYRMGAGAELPPLLLDNDEAIAVVLGLRSLAAGALAGVEETSLRALLKL